MDARDSCGRTTVLDVVMDPTAGVHLRYRHTCPAHSLGGPVYRFFAASISPGASLGTPTCTICDRKTHPSQPDHEFSPSLLSPRLTPFTYAIPSHHRSSQRLSSPGHPSPFPHLQPNVAPLTCGLVFFSSCALLRPNRNAKVPDPISVPTECIHCSSCTSSAYADTLPTEL